MVARLFHKKTLMKRNFTHIALITTMLCVSAIAKAYDFKDGDCYYSITSLSDQTVALTNSGEISSSSGEWDTHYVACYSGDFIVPQTADYSGKTFKVASIDNSAFLDCTLDKLTIPPTVVSASIEGKVKELIIEDSNIPLSDLTAKYVKEVYMGRDIIVPWNHLAGCFSNSDIEKITFGNSVTYIPGGIVEECQKLVSVDISDNVKKILNKAFSGCINLKTISGQNIEFIETGAFYDCSSLESFNFPNLKTIDNGDSQWGTYRWGVFQNCTSLKSVVLPQGLASIGTMGFMNCISLESIVIPASIISIGDKQNLEQSSVFANCTSLKSITINSPEPIAIGETTFDAQTYINATLKTPVGAKNKYMEAANWKNFFKIEEDANIKDDIISVVFNSIGNPFQLGYIEIDGKKYTDETTVIGAKKGETITLKFGSDSSDEYGGKYEVGSVRVNGANVTNKIVNNELTVEVTGNMTIDITWDYAEEEEEPVYLSVKQADNGNIKIKVSKWDEYNLIFEPAQGWKIHSVSFNGTDVTNDLAPDNSYCTPEITENSELVVVYVSSTDAVNAVHAESSSPKVVGYAGDIMISGAGEEETVYVYTTSGTLVNAASINNGATTVRVKDNEVYIVKVGDKTFKIGM